VKRRVLMTADTVGGVWTYALELARGLAPLDVGVTLAAMGGRPSPAQARSAAALPNLELLASEHALEWMPEPWRDVDAAGEWLLGIAERVRPDVVHVNGYAHAALPFRAPVITVAHSCVVTWLRAVRGAEAGPEWAEYRRRVRAGLLAADAVVAPTRAILGDVLAAYGVGAAGRVIPNGRAPGGVRAPKEGLVFSAGRLWDEAKGLATLAACAAQLPWPVVVAGPTRAPGGGGRRIPADGVRLLGELPPDEVAAWMARASIYALPACYEPFGLSALEAALAGCALVLGDLPTLREVWEHAAVYVPPGDPAALRYAIAALIRDPLLRGTLAASARARAARFTPARMAEAYRALYDELCGAAAAREVCA
jgi:glycogen(starch) synthase